jgi:hypothetical protein
MAFGFVRGLMDHADESRRLFRAVIGKRSGLAVQRRFREIVLELVVDELCAQGVRRTELATSSRFLTGAHATTTNQTQEAPMTEVGIAVPIAPGKTEAWRRSIEELTGPRYAEYESSRKRFGLTSQTTFLQRTPMGDFAVIHLSGPDVHASFHTMSTSEDDWDVKWRDLTLDLHGVDFAKGEKVLPKVMPAFATDDAQVAGEPFMFLAPLGPDGRQRLGEIAKAVMGPRHDDYVRARRQIGVQREAVFLESTSMGDAAVFYWVADDPVASLKRLAASMEPFDQWMRGQAEKAHPISLAAITAIASSNALIGRYPKMQ